ncbi:MAG TPA: RnfH family protein [Steroidobacteraceae bacterium]|nr:RnfH family protein [Steroidobacteraceae bacterium]
MKSKGSKRCVVAFALRDRQYLWTVEIPSNGTIGDALTAAREIANLPEAPWDSAPVGVYGELRQRSERVADGDRVELYRPLSADPRQRRRERVQVARKRT